MLLQTTSQLSLSNTPFKPSSGTLSQGFPIESLADPLPVSPVSMTTSRFTVDQESVSEYSTGSNSIDNDSDNAMDWTPTGPQAPTPQARPRPTFRKPVTKPSGGLFASLGQNPPALRPQDQVNGVDPSPFHF